LLGSLTEAAKGYVASEMYFREGVVDNFVAPDGPPVRDEEETDFLNRLEEDWEPEWEERAPNEDK
jgi:hypothetical protein